LSGVRKVVLVANLVPITAAGAILLSHGHATHALKVAWAVLLALSTIATLMLLASSFLPSGSRSVASLRDRMRPPATSG
jgi:hypothetical protein